MTQTREQVDSKARELLDQLTLEEKCKMMYGDMPFWKGIYDMDSRGYAYHTWDAGAIPRLGITGIKFADGPRGIVLKGATTFPVTMARGASWDVELEERIGEVMGTELRALGGNLYGGVCINLLRHPAWGRAQETYGEDPYHLGEMGAALTRGVQKHAMACVKHYALNSIENARFKLNVNVRPRALHEIYLPHFKRVVDEGISAVMSAYNSVNGEWCGQNKTLLIDILKKRWDFKGYVLTDFIFGMRCARKAALAGQDLEMPFPMLYHKRLNRLVNEGTVPLERIDDAVLRLIRQQLLLDSDRHYDHALIGCEKHRALAREAAQKSMVLLKNEGNVLPLKNMQKLAVIGRLASVPNTGDGGSSNTHSQHTVTLLEGIQKATDGATEVVYNDGKDIDQAKTIAQSVEAVILAIGYTSEDEGEFMPSPKKELISLFPRPSIKDIPVLIKLLFKRVAKSQSESFSVGGDRDSMNLRAHDEELIETVAAVNPNTVVCVMGGSAIMMEKWRQLVSSILMVWYPGMEGGHAVADILFGKVNPSGKLPFVIPTNIEHLPFFNRNATQIEYDLWHGYRKLEHDGNEPAFPFGFGLSYTTFKYDNLALEQDRLRDSGVLEVSLDISNIGVHPGEEIVQLYVSAIDSRVERAPKDLKDFSRISLQPGETQKVLFRVPVKQLAYYDEDRADFIVEPLEYQVYVGSHSLDASGLTAGFTVQ